MCYICKCFGWALDFVQRVLTFALSCIICFSICVGISVAIITGVAYGYHYMLAEFLTIGRQDLSVYVRRGQFHDKPDAGKGYRRRGDANDLFSSNSSDYQDTRRDTDTKPLSDTWRKALDTRKYADKLTKYSLGHFGNFYNKSQFNYDMRRDNVHTETPSSNDKVIHRVFSATPINMATTAHPLRTDIVMRNFQPPEEITISPESKEEFYQDTEDSTSKSKDKLKHKKKKPDIKISLKEMPDKSYVPMRSWGNTKYPRMDYPADDIDDDNTVYKPV